MTIPQLNQQELLAFLNNEGYEVVSDEHWEDYGRIMLKKEDVSFPLQLQKTYYYYTVNKICDDLGIEPPEHCAKVREQIRQKKEGQ